MLGLSGEGVPSSAFTPARMSVFALKKYVKLQIYYITYITKSYVENNSNDNIPKSENSLIVYQIMRLVCTVIRSHNITLKIYITPLSEDFGD